MEIEKLFKTTDKVILGVLLALLAFMNGWYTIISLGLGIFEITTGTDLGLIIISFMFLYLGLIIWDKFRRK